ncbi:MAG: TonB-dependent receptor [Rhodocyclaceae bacterium]|nr:TonB-dependent receptor [Rhodocyclaceae bacterium]
MSHAAWRQRGLALLIGAGTSPALAEIPPLAEGGYLGDLPVVLSVTRLAQSLADTPGAVTIIDRDFIRRSGARTVAELLRFVPGFRISGWNGANAIAAYHARLDEYGSRLQVFVDGRSVYSSLYLGDTHRGMAEVAMEDVERIEILRGSNSAAYGANAFLGVINIITRNSADTRGALISVNQGDHGISDQTVRYGWGSEDASYRITAARRSDSGYVSKQAYPAYYPPASDDTRLSQFAFRGDLHLPQGDELQLQFGSTRHQADDGDSTVGNAPYSTLNETTYVQAKWNRQMSSTSSVSLLATFDDERYSAYKVEDPTRIPGLAALFPFPIPVDTGGKSQRSQIEFSHTQQQSDTLRTVWGAAWRRESAQSRELFFSDYVYSQTQHRIFGNLEWRLSPQWLLNAGGLSEHNSEVGESLAPRIMLNYQPHPAHTLRIGATKATRTPSLFELYGNSPMINPQTGAPAMLPGGRPLDWKVRATGGARPERIYSQEVGWLGDFRKQALLIDVRAYKEQIRGLLTRRHLPLPNTYDINDYVNAIDADLQGLEYQVQWRPRAGTRLWFAQAFTSTRSDTQRDLQDGTPHNSYSAAWFQDLPANWEFALMYSHVGAANWRWRPSQRLDAYGVTNLRLARHFRLAGARSEIAATIQALEGDHYEFIQPGVDDPVVPVVPRRAFLTLRTEF